MAVSLTEVQTELTMIRGLAQILGQWNCYVILVTLLHMAGVCAQLPHTDSYWLKMTSSCNTSLHRGKPILATLVDRK